VLELGTRAFASDGDGRILAATNGGVFESVDGGGAWRRLGSLKARVEDVRRARLPERSLKTWSADAGGLTLWWDGVTGDAGVNWRKFILKFLRARQPRRARFCFHCA